MDTEILILRHPLNIPRRQSPMRLNFSTLDRLIFAGLYRLAPSILGALAIGASDRRMDRKSDHASVRLEAGPRYLIRDRDGACGEVFIRRVRSMGIRDRPTSPCSPWQNACAERLIGSIRRECLDHVVVFGERHLRHVLLSYMNYYNETRTHLSLDKDAPVSRTVQRAGRILRLPILGGLHHQYIRI